MNADTMAEARSAAHRALDRALDQMTAAQASIADCSGDAETRLARRGAARRVQIAALATLRKAAIDAARAGIGDAETR